MLRRFLYKELQRIGWKRSLPNGGTVTSFDRRNKGSARNSSVRTVCVLVKIWNKNLRKTNVKCFRYSTCWAALPVLHFGHQTVASSRDQRCSDGDGGVPDQHVTVSQHRFEADDAVNTSDHYILCTMKAEVGGWHYCVSEMRFRLIFMR
jgi:hypothetical protein